MKQELDRKPEQIFKLKLHSYKFKPKLSICNVAYQNIPRAAYFPVPFLQKLCKDNMQIVKLSHTSYNNSQLITQESKMQWLEPPNTPIWIKQTPPWSHNVYSLIAVETEIEWNV